MNERRVRTDDRRRLVAGPVQELPLIEGNGGLIKGNRREIPDRRINNISVEEIGCNAYITEVIKRERE